MQLQAPRRPSLRARARALASALRPHARVIAIAIASPLAILVPCAAHAEVSKPFPGVTLVKRPGSALAIADLCAAGVSVRATKYAERRRTPESWANLVGADVAINADFFDLPAATYSDGRARGAGEDWPAAQQNVGLRERGEDRHYWQFGPVLGADPVEPASRPPLPSAAATEIVGGHNVLIRNGKSLAPAFDGDGVLQSPTRRTAIATNADRSRLYLFTIGATQTGAQLVASLLSHAQEAGMADIDFASNMDGGGSTQMYVRGQGQIVTSGRLVATHLGIMAKGSGPAPMCPGKRPIGAFDSADCNQITGWAFDPDDKSKAIDVALSYDGIFPDPRARVVRIPAGIERPDLGAPFGTTAHGFAAPTAFGIFDGKPHSVWTVAVDSAGGRSAMVGGPKQVTCTAAPPPSTKRHITDPATLAAWRFDGFADMLPQLAEAQIAAFTDGGRVAAPPELATVAGGNGLYLVEDGVRRRVVDDASRRAWRFDVSKAKTRTAAELLALESGPPLRARPMLVKGAGAPIYLLDALRTERDEADPLVVGDGPGSSGTGTSSGGQGGPGTGARDGVNGEDDASAGCAMTPTRAGAPHGAHAWLIVAGAAMAASAARLRSRRGERKGPR